MFLKRVMSGSARVSTGKLLQTTGPA